MKAHGIELVGIRFGSDANQIQHISLLRIYIECAIIAGKLPATDIFHCRKINLHFRRSLADYGNDRHSGSHRLMGVEKAFLYISAERGIQAGIFQLVLSMVVFGGNLPQSVHGFVVCVGSGYIFLIKSHYTLRFRLDTLVFGFRRIQLNLIICRIKFGKQLSFAHISTVIHIHTLDSSAHPECQAYVLSRFHPSGKLQGSLFVSRKYGINLHCRLIFYILHTLIA